MPKSNEVYPKITHRKYLKQKDIRYGIYKELWNTILSFEICYMVVMTIRLFFDLFRKDKKNDF